MISQMRWTLSAVCAAALGIAAAAGPPAVGPNVNMVSNTTLGDGDPFLTKQNESSIAVSSLNNLHLVGGSNDYSLVDLSSALYTEETSDAWVRIFKSVDGGASWKSIPLPGCSLNIPLCNDPRGASIKGRQFASDPTVRSGPYGAFFYSFIAGNRGTGAQSIVAVARIFDRNDNVTINQDPFQIDVFNTIDVGTPGQDKDKPWVAADMPGRPWNGANKCTIPSYPAGKQLQPAFNAYVAYSNFTGQGAPHPAIYLARSTDCGATYEKATKLSEGVATNQGANVAVDPVTGAVYVVWRQFFTQENGSPDAIYIVKSTDGGKTFTKPALVSLINAFDQGTSAASFRTNDYPSLAVSVNGAGQSRVHVAWSQRGVGPGGDARIVMATSADGVTFGNFSPIDNWTPNTTYNPANPNGRGSQIMSSLFFSGGKLTAAWYDQREDQTVGVMVCPTGPNTCNSMAQFVEQRQAIPGSNLDLAKTDPSQYGIVFTPFITDGTPGLKRRHTLDVFVAMADPSVTDGAGNPVFVSSKASKYFFGSVSTPGMITKKVVQQLRFNAVNTRIFANFTVPFMGDYIDIAAALFVPTGNPNAPYAFNIASAPTPACPACGTTPFHATWADNRDIIPPKDGNYSNHTPISVLVTNPDGTMTVKLNPGCVSGQEGSKNQNVYTAVFGDGLGAFAVENSKVLPSDSTKPRGFVILVQNYTTNSQTYNLTIAPPPAGVKVSFVQDLTGLANPVTQIQVTVLPRSSVSRTVWATSSIGNATITVNVTDLGGKPLASIVLNGDPSSNLVTNSTGLNNDDLTNDDLTNDDLTNTVITNDDLTNDDLTNDDLTNVVITNDDLTNLGIPQDDLTNHEIANDDLTNNLLTNDDLTNGALTDKSFTTTNNGNTDVSLNVKMLLRNKTVPPGFKLQLILHKVYVTPMPKSCNYGNQVQNVQVVNVPLPNVADPDDAKLTTPDVTNGNGDNPFLHLRSGESGKITLRITGGTTGTKQDVETFGQNSTKFVAAGPSSVATPTPLIIKTLSLPNGTYGTAYSFTIQTAGGKAPLGWSIIGGSLPPNVSLDSTGQITGTPGAAGTFTFTVKATDASIPQQFDSQTLTLVIAPASLTVTADNKSKAYGAAIPALSFTPNGLAAGDTVLTAFTTQPTCVTTAKDTSSAAGSPYPITCSGGIAPNYTISYVAGSLTVTPVPLTVKADDKSRAFGAANPSFTFSLTGLVGGDTAATAFTTQPVCTTTATTNSSVAGSPYPITCSGGVSPNYTLSYSSGSLTVNAATVTVTADNKTTTYGAAPPAVTFTPSGLAAGDTAATAFTTQPTCSTTATSSSSVAGSPYPITCSGGVAPNYTISYVSGSLTVSPAPLTVTAEGKSKMYGSANPTLTFAAASFVNGDTVATAFTTQPTCTTTATPGSSVAGSPYAITCSGGVAPNYAISYSPGSLNVTPAPLTVKADDKSKTYGSANPTLTFAAATFVNGDTVATAFTTQPTCTTTATSSSSVAGSPYPITCSGGVAANYTVGYAPGSLTVNPAPLTVTADGKSKTYGAAIPALTFTPSGLATGDTAATAFTTQPTCSTTATSSSSVAGSPYPITCLGGVAPNYTIGYAPGSLTVTPATLTATADNQSRTYGNSNPTLTFQYSGFVNGETASVVTTPPTCSTTATTNSPVAGSPYPITCSGGVAANYTFSYAPGSLTVTSAPLTVTADNKSKTYGAGNPALTFTPTGLVAGDTAATAFTTQPACTTTAVANSSVAGSPYPITCSGGVAPNYTIGYAPGSLTVGPAPLTVTADNKSKTYGAAIPALTFTSTGLVAGDTAATAFTTQPACTTTATASSSVAGSPYPITCSGGVAPNYTLSYAGGSLTITPATSVLSGLASPTIAEGTASTALSGTIGSGAPFPTGSVSITVNGGSQAAPISSTTGAFSSSFATATLAPGSYPITYSYAGDGNFGPVSGGGTLTITNLPPAITANGPGVTVNEGALATMGGTYSDVESVAITASAGTVTKTGTNSGTWSWSLLTTDGPAQSGTVTISANDGNGGISKATFTLVVNNVAPTATFNAPAAAVQGATYTLSLTSPADPSSVDTAAGFSYAFDCGDGSGMGAYGASSSVTCPAMGVSARTVVGSIRDKDLGHTEYSATVTATMFTFTLLHNSMTVERSNHTATKLIDGKVLVAGGFNARGQSLGSAELYDPATQTFAATGNMPNKAAGHTATLLPNGKVVIVGGGNSSAQIYDPAAGTFSSTGGGSNISYHSATLLPNGKVLIAGGSNNSGVTTGAALLYDPAAGTFSATGSMATARERHTATLLLNGKVLIAGGRTNNTQVLASAEIYDPAAGTFSAAGAMGSARHSHTAVLANGKVLIAGGSSGSADLSVAEVYDPVGCAPGPFCATGSLAGARDSHTATLMSGGIVLEAGGANAGVPIGSAELYNGSSAFVAGGNMVVARTGHAATLLTDGSVLITGGKGAGGNAVSSAERYAAP